MAEGEEGEENESSEQAQEDKAEEEGWTALQWSQR